MLNERKYQKFCLQKQTARFKTRSTVELGQFNLMFVHEGNPPGGWMVRERFELHF